MKNKITRHHDVIMRFSLRLLLERERESGIHKKIQTRIYFCEKSNISLNRSFNRIHIRLIHSSAGLTFILEMCIIYKYSEQNVNRIFIVASRFTSKHTSLSICVYKAEKYWPVMYLFFRSCCSFFAFFLTTNE